MKKLFGLLSTSLLVGLMSLGLVNKVDNKEVEAAPKKDVLEVKDVLKNIGEEDGKAVKRVAAPAAAYVMSDAKVQVTTPEADGTVDVRFVAAIDSFDYGKANFTIEMFDGANSKGKISREVTKAYTGILLGDEVYTAADIFGEGYEYFIAYTLIDMPRDVWSYGFKVTTGLMKADDEAYTEKTTEDVKVIKNAIIADNHLVFTWSPWSDNGGLVATLNWENNFASADVSSLDSSIEENKDLIKAEINEKIKVELTLEDGTTRESTTVTPHVVDIDGKQVSVRFTNVDLRIQAHTVKVTIELADGTKVTGVTKIDKLDDVKNLKVTPSDDKFVLTFDAVENATSYEYRIYNEKYVNGAVVKINNTQATINPLGLDNGSYNIEITAKGNGYTSSTTQFLEAFEISNAQIFMDATDFYDIELIHEGGNWEGEINFRTLSPEYEVVGTHKVSNLEIYAGEKLLSDAKIIKWGGSPGDYDYDLDNGYHSFSFTTGAYYNANTIYTVKFLVQTGTEEKPGPMYSVEFRYIVGSSANGAFPIDQTLFSKNHFVLLLNAKYNAIDFNEFDASIAELIENNYNSQLAIINDEQTTSDDAYKAVNDFVSYVEVLKADKDLSATKEAYLAKIKTSYDVAKKHVTEEELDVIYNTAKDSITNAISSSEVSVAYDTFVANFIAKVDELTDESEFEFVGATASSGNANNAIDFSGEGVRDEGTRWESVSNDSEHIIFDLGENSVYVVTKISIKWETARAKDYDVQVSLDGVNWTTVKEVRDVTDATLPDEITMDLLAEARYIKIQCIKRATDYGNSIWDFRAYGL